MQPVNIGLLGLGTVGGGTVNVLARNREEIARRAGREIRVTCASARDVNKPRACPTDGIALHADPFEVVRAADVEVVAELIGGETLARELVLAAIDAGKHVVTANKALIALHGNEIFERAQARGVTVAFEAAVAGGVPIIKAVREGLAGNRIEWLAGIINGTSNYILTEMRDSHLAGGGTDFAAVLADAQAKGYAEADPTFDVEGVDAAHKLTILASIAFGIPLGFDKVHVEGISGVTLDDIAYAEQLGYRIKHLGLARRRADGFELRVHATLVPHKALLANVDGVLNAVLVQADAVGQTLYCGAGAGADATASAVVADLVDVVRALTSDPENRVPHLAFQPGRLSDKPVLPVQAAETAFYLRMPVADRPGALADIAQAMAAAGISIEAVVQPEPPRGAPQVQLVLLTHRVREGQMDSALAAMRDLDVVRGDITRLRLEPLDA